MTTRHMLATAILLIVLVAWFMTGKLAIFGLLGLFPLILLTGGKERDK